MTIREALQNLVYLHACEQEGIESGQPTPEQWFKAVEDAEEALRKEQEQEQGEDIRDILIDFIADWYKDNPTVSKEKIIKMADNYLAKFPNGQPKQVTLKEANEIISKEHPDVRYTSEQPSIELSDEEYRTMLFERSQLFMPYGVKDKEGKFRDVVDVQTVIEIFKEQHTSPKPNK